MTFHGQKGLRLYGGKRDEWMVRGWSISTAGTDDFFSPCVMLGVSFTFLSISIWLSGRGFWEHMVGQEFRHFLLSANVTVLGINGLCPWLLESLGKKLQTVEVASSWHYKSSWLAFCHFSEVKPASFFLKENRHLELKHSLATGEVGTLLQYACAWNPSFWEGNEFHFFLCCQDKYIWCKSDHSASVMIHEQNDHSPGGITVCQGNSKMRITSGSCAT